MVVAFGEFGAQWVELLWRFLVHEVFFPLVAAMAANFVENSSSREGERSGLEVATADLVTVV